MGKPRAFNKVILMGFALTIVTGVGYYLQSHNTSMAAKNMQIPVGSHTIENSHNTQKLPASETEFIAQQEAELDQIYFENHVITTVGIEPPQTILPRSHQIVQNRKTNADEEILDSDALLEANLLTNMSLETTIVPARGHNKTLASVSLEVMTIDGLLNAGFERAEDCSANPCENIIIEIATEKIVWNGAWQTGFLPTYNGKQVIKTDIGA